MAKKINCEECQFYDTQCQHPLNKVLLVKYRQEKEVYINTNKDGNCKNYVELSQE